MVGPDLEAQLGSIGPGSKSLSGGEEMLEVTSSP
eukprot:CAMPEP_0197451016 /NCGR_PEP_ID=MMETSP1175-20131217/27393_1 /TAXON_ID=1003142 /ORGANISM="Triceratium dubium, Strain CCMP147" /LENGTH=33 /DNA_ID= /DNA_START= /DNA_END= /DNA_ORIENTATION=